jgi:uncharacterized protein YjbJ (UPF0337 family)
MPCVSKASHGYARYLTNKRLAGGIIIREEQHVNWDQIEAKWKQLKGELKMKWAKLTDDDLNFIAGKKDQLVGKLQQRYGISKEEAQNHVENWNPETAGATKTEPLRERKVG